VKTVKLKTKCDSIIKKKQVRQQNIHQVRIYNLVNTNTITGGGHGGSGNIFNN
jgi:hypothetical protein